MSNITDDDGPPEPEGLSADARTLWHSYADALNLDGREVAILAQAARTLTEIDRMAESLAANDIVTTGSRSQPRPNPLLGELAKSRTVLARLLREIRVDEPTPPRSATRGPASLPTQRGR